MALAYAAYQAPLVDAIHEPLRLAGSFVGLHPPLYGLIHATIEHLLPIPLIFLGFSALCSWLAVLFVALAARLLLDERAALVATALAATSPLALHYAAEVNDYPLAQALVAGLVWAWARYGRAGGGWWLLAVLGVLATWTHILGGVVAAVLGLLVLRRHPLEGLKYGLVLLVATSPVWVQGLLLCRDAHTFGQPPLLLIRSLLDWKVRFGYLAIPAVLLALTGLPRLPDLGFVSFILASSITSMVLLGVAAPHQFPYWCLLMPFGALLAAAASMRWLSIGALVLAGVQGSVALRDEVQPGYRIYVDQHRIRAVDVALRDAAPGDALWLISPALEPDDDKRAISPVLWRLSPWRSMPMARPFPMDYTDYRLGQPRMYGDLVVYTFTDFWPDRMDAILEHHTRAGQHVRIALYDHGPAREYPQRLRTTLEPWQYDEERVGRDMGLGVDRLLVVTGPVEAP